MELWSELIACRWIKLSPGLLELSDQAILNDGWPYLGDRKGSGKMFISSCRLGGVCSLVGGVDASERPEEPAVEGLPSIESFLGVPFLRMGTPSGHVH